MALTTWNPFREMEELVDRYNRSTGKAITQSENCTFESGDWVPLVDISEDVNAFTVKAELPGVDKKDISINLDNNILTIKGKKQLETEDKKHHRVECSYGSFVRSFTLPKHVNPDAVDAEYDNGVLFLNIPKKEETKPRQIEVKVK